MRRVKNDVNINIAEKHKKLIENSLCFPDMVVELLINYLLPPPYIGKLENNL